MKSKYFFVFFVLFSTKLLFATSTTIIVNGFLDSESKKTSLKLCKKIKKAIKKSKKDVVILPAKRRDLGKSFVIENILLDKLYNKKEEIINLIGIGSGCESVLRFIKIVDGEGLGSRIGKIVLVGNTSFDYLGSREVVNFSRYLANKAKRILEITEGFEEIYRRSLEDIENEVLKDIREASEDKKEETVIINLDLDEAGPYFNLKAGNCLKLNCKCTKAGIGTVIGIVGLVIVAIVTFA